MEGKGCMRWKTMISSFLATCQTHRREGDCGASKPIRASYQYLMQKAALECRKADILELADSMQNLGFEGAQP